MFGLDLTAIIAAAIGGGIGGGIGGLLGGLLTKSQTLRMVLVLIPALVGSQILLPYIAPQVEKFAGIRADQFDASYENELMPEIRKVPALVRVFRDHPDVEAKFRAKAREAYAAGGPKGLVEQVTAIGALVLSEAFIDYMPRARREDLIQFAATTADVLSALNEKDPEACIFYQFGARYGKALSSERLLAAIGQERHDKQIAVMNAIVTNAADAPVPFDDTKATLAIAALGARHTPKLTGNSSQVAGGQRPPADAAEAKIACSYAADLFGDLASLEPETAEIAMRKMFTRPKL